MTKTRNQAAGAGSLWTEVVTAGLGFAAILHIWATLEPVSFSLWLWPFLRRIAFLAMLAAGGVTLYWLRRSSRSW